MYIHKGMIAAMLLLFAAQPLHAADETAPPTPSESPSAGTESTPTPAPQTPPQDDTQDKESESSDPDCE